MNRILLFLAAAFAAVSATAVPAPGGAVERPGPVFAVSDPALATASFRGGTLETFERYVIESLDFSEDLYKEGDLLQMAVAFRVVKSGKVKDAEVKKSSGDESLDKEVLRLVKESTGWTLRKSENQNGSGVLLWLSLKIGRGPDGKLFAEDYSAYEKADTMPTFEGGGPEEFRRRIEEQIGETDPDGAPINARVMLRFVIEKDGSMSNLSVDKETPAWLVERLGIVLGAMPRWTPGVMQGELVRIRTSVQLYFGGEDEQTAADASEDDDLPFLIVERMPSFQGGDLNTFRNWVNGNVEYPANKKGGSGRVLAAFVVNKDGSVSDIEILQSPGKEFSQAVVAALEKSPKWSPGVQNGRVVRVKFVLPVDFRKPSGSGKR